MEPLGEPSQLVPMRSHAVIASCIALLLAVLTVSFHIGRRPLPEVVMNLRTSTEVASDDTELHDAGYIDAGLSSNRKLLEEALLASRATYPRVIFPASAVRQHTRRQLTSDQKARQHQLLLPICEARGQSHFYISGPPVGDEASVHSELLSLADETWFTVADASWENRDSDLYEFEIFGSEHHDMLDLAHIWVTVVDDQIRSVSFFYYAD
jgi:hypothetical protein